MTEPSQYFKGRTVQEQMNEVIGYVDVRAEEVAAAKANDVLEPAEQAKTDAIAAKEAAEQARDTTLAALPAVNERIDDVESDLNAVTLRVTTAEGDIVTIQGRVTALETADGQNVKINNINQYAVGLSGEQDFNGPKRALQPFTYWSRIQRVGNSVGNTTSWFKVCDFISTTGRVFMLEHFTSGNYSEWGEIRFASGGATFTSHKTGNAPSFKVTLDVNNTYSLWINPGHTYTYSMVAPKIETSYGNNVSNPFDNIIFDTSMVAHPEPVVGSEFTQVIDGVLIE